MGRYSVNVQRWGYINTTDKCGYDELQDISHLLQCLACRTHYTETDLILPNDNVQLVAAKWRGKI